ncbi:DUF4387 domain-containing protein [Verticiella sediminum]|uniref:DUF4387 domain-containing protein n=1 Tax=Verticiella sediminum TaxID=1247510 RepID=A0A556AXD0_9BURK|nr:DUF4387 domain-containing protein [Verticiella sediminum]TSH97603.1 DUF4387 domain-containing protein [Verticiella sediminum]
MTTPLSELAVLIRSKNAGPFSLTFDIMFSSRENYERVKASGTLTRATMAALYGCPAEKTKFFECDNALAIKFSIPRPRPSGELGDGDLHGGQQYAPLLSLPIPA